MQAFFNQLIPKSKAEPIVEEEELEYCGACDTEQPVEGGEEVVVDRTYVDHMMVSEDREFVCAGCIEAAEEAQLERQLESRYWRGYDEGVYG